VAYPTDPANGQRAAGPFPVIIEHTPYVRLGQPVNPNTYLIEHGYIYAVVRARGTGASGGEFQNVSSREGLDGKLLVDWAAHHLRGSDGRVALIGCSWPGGIALADAAHAGPNSPVKAVVASCIGFSADGSANSLSRGLMTGGFWNFIPRIPQLMGNTLSIVKYSERLMTEIPAGGDIVYDGTYLQDHSPLSWAQDIVDNGIPVLLWAGWQESLGVNALRTYTALQNASDKRSIYAPMALHQLVTPRYQIIMGNWQHAAGLDVGVYLEWLETWVKGIDTGLQKTSAPMHLFEPGSNRWTNLATYPAAPESTAWSLRGSGLLKSGAPRGAAGSETLVWGDPTEAGGTLNFTTPPLAKGATLSGPISATLYASSSNTNLELIAHLFDVAPDGQTTLISRGAVLGSQRAIDEAKSWSDRHGVITWPWATVQRDDYLKPGSIYRFNVALDPRHWAINPDHRMRLELTTQAPTDVCPPTGVVLNGTADPCRLTVPQQASVPGGTYQIMYGPKWPSALNLPQLRRDMFPEVRAGTPPTSWSENQRKLEIRDLTLPLDWGSAKTGGPTK
jgi:uncharacterized protein